MDIEEYKNRIKNALIIIAEGQPFKVKDLLFYIKAKNILTITGWTNQNNLDNINRDMALSELDKIKLIFSKMLDLSDELKDFISTRKVEYYLNYDYGKGSIEICSEIDTIIKFYAYN